MDDQSAQRRLAAIVAIDVAGFSARTEADEPGAVAEITALGERIAKACASHGGRVFNTAGDGFMLEFPTVTGALQAAAELAMRGDPPVRVGVHLGEVSVTPSGDLLGHGVNVAARLQALAAPGAVMVSADVRRALRGPLADRLVAKGTVRLAKMDETIAVFALEPASEPGAPRPTARRPWRRAAPWTAALILVLAAGLAGLWFWMGHGTDSKAAGDPRVAVLPLQILSADPPARYFAVGLGDELTNALTANHATTLAAARTAADADHLGAAFLLNGSVERDGDDLRVRLRLDDARSHVTLWTDSFSGPAAAPAALQVAVAAEAADVVGFALDARRSPGGDALDAATLADFIQANAIFAFTGPDNAFKARNILLRVTTKAPNFARGHSALAVYASVAMRAATPDQTAALAQEAKVHALRALRLDPNCGEAYVALTNLQPRGHWAERERLLRKGLSVAPDFPFLNNILSYMLANVGRTQEGVAVSERGLALNALHPGANYEYAVHLAQAGRYENARAVAEQTATNWPKPWTDIARLSLVMIDGPTDEARRLLHQAQAHPLPGEAPSLVAWASYLRARETRSPADVAAAVRAISATAAPGGGVRLSEAVMALSRLGALDAAFGLVNSVSPAPDLPSDMLFAPSTAPLRHDPRFWAVAARVGLADYWLKTGHWPDACGPSGDLSDCPAQAAAALKATAARP